MFDITSEDIEYARVFSKQEGRFLVIPSIVHLTFLLILNFGMPINAGRILSLCWHKDGQILVAGGSDATIRVYEVSTGHARLRITLDNFSERKTLVWSIAVTR